MTVSTWNLAPPPGFQGLDENQPVRFHARHLPHWRQDGTTYFVTFRLCDSLPQSKLNELRAVRAEWLQRHPAPRGHDAWQSLLRSMSERVERWLDEGMGACLLKEPGHASHVVESLHHFDGERYELDCYVVMPNHVHVIVRPTRGELEDIVGGWKQHSALWIGRAINAEGGIWQQESFDRIIRDEEHLYRTLQYIGRNPVKAGLALGTYSLWLRPDWAALGWRIETPYDGLPGRLR